MATLTKKDLLRAYTQGFIKGLAWESEENPKVKDIEECFNDFYTPKKNPPTKGADSPDEVSLPFYK